MIYKMRHCMFTLILLAFSLNATCQTINKEPAKVKTPILFNHSFADSLPQPSGYVNQYAIIYSPAQVVTLDSLIGDFEKRTTIQIALISFDTSMFKNEDLEFVTRKIANFWGVGQKDKNNGIVIGICKGYRKMTIQNGYGIEKILTNEETQEIINTAFIPSFKSKQYFEGTRKGLEALMKVLVTRTVVNQ